MFIDLTVDLYTSWYGYFLYLATTVLVGSAMLENVSDYRVLKLGIVDATKESWGEGVFSFQLLLTFAMIWWILSTIGYHDTPGIYYLILFVTGIVTIIILTAVLPGYTLILKHKITFRGLANMNDVDVFLALRKHIRLCDNDDTKICRNCSKTYYPAKIKSLVAKHTRRYAIKWNERKNGNMPLVLRYFYASYNNRCCSPECQVSYLEKIEKEIKDRDREHNRLWSLRKVYELTNEEFHKIRSEWDKAHKKCGNCVHDVDNQCVLKAVTDTGYPAVLNDTKGCSEGFKLKPNAMVPKKIKSGSYTLDEKGTKTEVGDPWVVD